jgi:dTDP-4-dehydrorhamnose reductase
VTRLLVTGASGFLGDYLVGAAQAAGGWEITGTCFSTAPPRPISALRRLDLRDRDAVRRLIDELHPDSVIHTACSNRDGENINAIVPAAENLAAACHEHAARLVHVSTDMVFDGERAPYSDDASPHPISPYGAAKAEAEAAVQHRHPAAAIGRPSLIWSLEPVDRQTAWLVDGLRRGAPVTLFSDEIRCPVYLPDLAAALLELAARPELSGPLNLAGRQPLSRWDFGLRLLRALGLEPAGNLRPGTLAASGLVRPRNLQLACARASCWLPTPLRGVDAVLNEGRMPAAVPEGRAG